MKVARYLKAGCTPFIAKSGGLTYLTSGRVWVVSEGSATRLPVLFLVCNSTYYIVVGGYVTRLGVLIRE